MDRLFSESYINLLAKGEYGDICAKVAKQLLDTMRENERLRSLLGDKLPQDMWSDDKMKDKAHSQRIETLLSNKDTEFYLHGPITTTTGDIRDPDTWKTTEQYPSKT